MDSGLVYVNITDLFDNNIIREILNEPSSRRFEKALRSQLKKEPVVIKYRGSIYLHHFLAQHIALHMNNPGILDWIMYTSFDLRISLGSTPPDLFEDTQETKP